MKQITEYILEKANFLVKKHVKTQYKVAMNIDEIEDNCVMKYRSHWDNDFLILFGNNVPKPFPEDKMLEVPIIIDMDKDSKYCGRISFNNDADLSNGTFDEPTKEDLEMISVVEKFYNENKNIGRTLFEHKYENGEVIKIK